MTTIPPTLTAGRTVDDTDDTNPTKETAVEQPDSRYGPRSSYAEVEIASGAAQQVQRLVDILRDVESGRAQAQRAVDHERALRMEAVREQRHAEGIAERARNERQSANVVISNMQRALEKLYAEWKEEADRHERVGTTDGMEDSKRIHAWAKHDTLRNVISRLQDEVYKPLADEDIPF